MLRFKLVHVRKRGPRHVTHIYSLILTHWARRMQMWRRKLDVKPQPQAMSNRRNIFQWMFVHKLRLIMATMLNVYNTYWQLNFPYFSLLFCGCLAYHWFVNHLRARGTTMGLYSQSLTARSREVSKPRDSGSDFSITLKFDMLHWQQRCLDGCQISKRYDH